MLPRTLKYLVILMVLNCTSAFSATLRVDTYDVSTHPDKCSLADAIIAANRDQQTGGCPPGHGEDTIVLSRGTYRITEAADSIPNSLSVVGLPLIQSNIEVVGNGAIIESSDTVGSTSSSLLGVNRYGNLTLEDLTIQKSRGAGIFVQGGHATLRKINVTGNGVGGVRITKGATLTVERSAISKNSNSGTTYIAGIDIGDGSSVTVTDSEIIGNVGGGIGCSISCSDGRPNTIRISNSRIVHNGGKYNGAISAHNSRLILKQSIITDNGYPYGTVIYSSDLETHILNSTISNNSSSFGTIVHAGAHTLIKGCVINDNLVYMPSLASIVITKPGARLINTTISNNTSKGGPAVSGETGTRILNCTITGNLSKESEQHPALASGVAGNITLINSIVANNSGAPDCSGPLGPASTANIIGDGSCGTRGASDPLIGPLQDNGGATKTHALLPGSPAIDAGDESYCLAADVGGIDARGVQRPQDGDGDGAAGCDIGAFELGNNHAPTFEIHESHTSFMNPGFVFVPGWATNISDGDIGKQQLWFETTYVSEPSLFTIPPRVSVASGTLYYEPAPDVSGQATVSLRLLDNGGKDRGGVDSSREVDFTINIDPSRNLGRQAPLPQNIQDIFTNLDRPSLTDSASAPNDLSVTMKENQDSDENLSSFTISVNSEYRNNQPEGLLLLTVTGAKSIRLSDTRCIRDGVSFNLICNLSDFVSGVGKYRLTVDREPGKSLFLQAEIMARNDPNTDNNATDVSIGSQSSNLHGIEGSGKTGGGGAMGMFALFLLVTSFLQARASSSDKPATTNPRNRKRGQRPRSRFANDRGAYCSLKFD